MRMFQHFHIKRQIYLLKKNHKNICINFPLRNKILLYPISGLGEIKIQEFSLIISTSGN